MAALLARLLETLAGNAGMILLLVSFGVVCWGIWVFTKRK